MALLGDGESEVDAHRRLAHSSLAGGDGNDSGGGLDPGRAGVLAGPPASDGHELGPLFGGHGCRLDGDLGDSGKGADLADRVCLDLGAHGACGDREGDPDRDVTMIHSHPRDHAQFDDVGAELGIDDPDEGTVDVFGPDLGERANHDTIVISTTQVVVIAFAEEEGNLCRVRHSVGSLSHMG